MVGKRGILTSGETSVEGGKISGEWVTCNEWNIHGAKRWASGWNVQGVKCERGEGVLGHCKKPHRRIFCCIWLASTNSKAMVKACFADSVLVLCVLLSTYSSKSKMSWTIKNHTLLSLVDIPQVLTVFQSSLAVSSNSLVVFSTTNKWSAELRWSDGLVVIGRL